MVTSLMVKAAWEPCCTKGVVGSMMIPADSSSVTVTGSPVASVPPYLPPEGMWVMGTTLSTASLSGSVVTVTLWGTSQFSVVKTTGSG